MAQRVPGPVVHMSRRALVAMGSMMTVVALAAGFAALAVAPGHPSLRPASPPASRPASRPVSLLTDLHVIAPRSPAGTPAHSSSSSSDDSGPGGYRLER